MAEDYDSDERHESDSDHDESQESEESEESSSDEATNGLLDVEASEADSEEPDFEAQHGFSYVGDSYLDPFPKFLQLPAELREMVWEAFCPDLTAGPRVLGICLVTSGVSKLVPGPCLEDQTAPMRTLLAVHKESRALGLKSSPHIFTLSQGEVIRYHEERDVIHFALPESWEHDIEIVLGAQQLKGSPQNIAIESGWAHMPFTDFCHYLPTVLRVFIIFDDDKMEDVSGKRYSWVVSDKAHHYYTETQEDGEAGLVVDVRRLFCWPNLDKHPEFTEQIFGERDTDASPLDRQIQLFRDCLADPLSYAEELERDLEEEEADLEDVERLKEVGVLPMIRFDTDSALRHFHAMKAWDQPWDEWDSGASSASSDDEPDEYESEGIDDRSVNDYLSTDEEDDLPGQRSAGEDDEDEADSDQLLGGSSQINGGELAAQFSSEEDEAEEQDGGADASGSEDEDDSRSRASRPKRRVVESDSENESATETEEAPRPASNRRGRAVLADSEDEGDEEEDLDPKASRGRGRRVRAPPSDSEDEGEDENDVPQPSRAQKNRRVRAVPADSEEDDDGSDSEEGGAKAQQTGSSDEDEEGSSDEEDDEPAPPKRMSLAKRLKMEAQASRRRQATGDDSDADRDEYGAASDDDEEGDDGASGPDGLAMGEDDGDGEESEEDF